MNIMTDQTKMECGIIAGLQGSLNAKIDAQTIYHLLIDKGILPEQNRKKKQQSHGCKNGVFPRNHNRIHLLLS